VSAKSLRAVTSPYCLDAGPIHMMISRTDDQVVMQCVLNQLGMTGGSEEDFENHHVVRSATIRIFQFLCEDQEWLDCVPTADGSNFKDYSVWMETYKWFKQ